MEIITKKIDEVIPYENNPRKNDEAVEYVAKSIEQFGFKVPIIIDKDNVIVTGHTRLKAAKKLGLKEVPCIMADDLTEEQIKAFRLADNKVGEIATWDFDLLNTELENIFDIDMDDFGFSLNLDGETDSSESSPLTDEKYTTKVEIPQYEITGEEPSLDELVDLTKTNELIAKINKSNATEEQKKFLIEAAKRHSVFNYSKIAEYYAHQEKEMQELMEDSALVIIDFDDAIKNGYVQLRSEILGFEEQDYEDEE
jgi:ParB-like chromosome segregation protein Spo0J